MTMHAGSASIHRIVAALAAVALLAAACDRGGVPHPPPGEVVVAQRPTLPLDPAATEWRDAPEFPAALIPQDMVEPRLLVPSTKEVRVRALTDGRKLAFRLEWLDATADDAPTPARFSDACAVQLPTKTSPDVPAPQMGEPGRPVEIAYWRASWQVSVAGRPDTITALYPHAAIDHYPFEAPALGEGTPEREEMAKRYAPARALDNRMAGPRDQPVEDLVVEGPGTLRPGPPQSQGGGKRGDTGWSVVLVRPLPQGLGPGARTQVAFAVWDGANQEAGARKMRTAWVPLTVEGVP